MLKPLEEAERGIISERSAHSVDELVSKIKEMLSSKGIKLFALIDHSGEAQLAGLRMPNTKLLIFGNPTAGTPAMLAAPTAAIDLPLKILVAENSAGEVSVSWNSSAYLLARHGLADDFVSTLNGAEVLARLAAGSEPPTKA